MNLNDLGNVGSFLQGVVGLLTLWTVLYVLKQTKEMRQQNQLAANANMAGVYQNLAETMLDIDKIFLAHPEWKPYFYAKQSASPDQSDYAKIETLAEMLLDFMDLALDMKGTSQCWPPEVSGYWDGWAVYFQSIYDSSPILRELWATHSAWYGKELNVLFADSHINAEVSSEKS